MQSPHTALADGRAPSVPRQVGVRSELGALPATCRSRGLVIDALGEAVSALCRAAALKAENADLRTEHDRLRSGRRMGVRATGGVDTGATRALRRPSGDRARQTLSISDQPAGGRRPNATTPAGGQP
jgi:hypothetical protein